MRIIPWVLTLLLALAVAWSLLFRGDEAPPTSDPVAERVTTLESVQAMEGGGAKSFTPAPPQSTPDRAREWVACRPTQEESEAPEVSLSTCLQHPAVRRHLAAVARAPVGSEERSEALVLAASEEQQELRVLLGKKLGLDDRELDGVSEFACTLKQLRWQTIRELSRAGEDLEQTAQALEAERLQVLGQLEVFLGMERYRDFRRLGGIGLFNDVNKCEAP